MHLSGSIDRIGGNLDARTPVRVLLLINATEQSGQWLPREHAHRDAGHIHSILASLSSSRAEARYKGTVEVQLFFKRHARLPICPLTFRPALNRVFNLLTWDPLALVITGAKRSKAHALMFLRSGFFTLVGHVRIGRGAAG